MHETLTISDLKEFANALHKALGGNLNKKAQDLMMPQGRLTIPDFTKPPKQSAVLILFYPDKDGIYFPLIRRPRYDGAHSGQMALPGGKREKEDEDLIYTALRETCEEIGVCLGKADVLGVLSEHFIPVTNMIVLPVIGVLHETPIFEPEPNEVEEIFTINLQEFFNRENKKRETWKLRGQDVEVPFYLLKHQKVWGATAMILSELEYLLTHALTTE